MQNEDGLKKSIPDIVKKKYSKKPNKGVWQLEHIFNFQHCLFGSSSSEGMSLRFLCHLGWCPGLLTQECGQWTKPSFQGLQRGKRSLPDTTPCPSLCYFLPAGSTWRGRPGVSLALPRSHLPPLFLNRPHFLQTLKGTKWKRKPMSHQAT